MSFISKDSGGAGFDPVPEGTHIARCISVVDLGIQESNWGKKEKVYIGFEIPAIRVEWDKDDQHHEGAALIGSTYTNSIHEKSILGQHLTSWRGKNFTDEEREGFDLFSILGAPCLLSVTHNSTGNKVYANITAIMRLADGMSAPPAQTDIIGYSPADADRSANLAKLPEWLQKKCAEGHGKQAEQPAEPPPKDDEFGDEFDSDIPFAFILPTAIGFILAAQSMVPII